MPVADLVQTPYMDFLMVNIPKPVDDPSQTMDLFDYGLQNVWIQPHKGDFVHSEGDFPDRYRSPLLLYPPNGSDHKHISNAEHVLEIADEHPDIYIQDFSLGGNEIVEGGTLKYLTDENKIAEIAKLYPPQSLADEIARAMTSTTKQDLLNHTRSEVNVRFPKSPSELAYEHFKINYLQYLWDEIVQAHAENALDCSTVPKIKIFRYMLKVADNDTGSNNGHGPFEITLMNIVSRTEPEVREGMIYPVSTLELEITNTISGSGHGPFSELF